MTEHKYKITSEKAAYTEYKYDAATGRSQIVKYRFEIDTGKVQDMEYFEKVCTWLRDCANDRNGCNYFHVGKTLVATTALPSEWILPKIIETEKYVLRFLLSAEDAVAFKLAFGGEQ